MLNTPAVASLFQAWPPVIEPRCSLLRPHNERMLQSLVRCNSFLNSEIQALVQQVQKQFNLLFLSLVKLLSLGYDSRAQISYWLRLDLHRLCDQPSCMFVLLDGMKI